MTSRIHPSASIHPSAQIAEDVEIGAGCVVGPQCVVGRGTRLHPAAMVVSHTTLGEGNELHPCAIIGGDPQDRKYNPSRPGRLIIGDRNVFREHVTINRSVGDEVPTRVGSGCYLMAYSHFGHNAQIGDGVTLANCACVAGHGRVGSGSFLSGGGMMHQYCSVGELVMFQGLTAVSQHVPPFVIVTRVNVVVGLNRVGLARSGRFTPEERENLKQVYRLMYRDREQRTMSDALAAASEREWGRPATIFLDFIRNAMSEEPPRRRGLCGPPRRRPALVDESLEV